MGSLFRILNMPFGMFTIFYSAASEVPKEKGPKVPPGKETLDFLHRFLYDKRRRIIFKKIISIP